jgi:hypothetical protein
LSIHDVFGIGCGWLMTVMGFIAIPRMWRSEARVYVMPSSRPVVFAFRRALVLTVPAFCAAVTCFTFALTAHFALDLLDGFWWSLSYAVRNAFLTLLALPTLLGVSAFLVNRPKAIVAPYLRAEKGFFGQWRELRRSLGTSRTH